VRSEEEDLSLGAFVLFANNLIGISDTSLFSYVSNASPFAISLLDVCISVSYNCSTPRRRYHNVLLIECERSIGPSYRMAEDGFSLELKLVYSA
jgi:hypothetical protein